MSDPIDVRGYGDSGPVVTVLHGGPGAPGSAGGLAAPLGDEFRVLEPMQRRADAVTPLTVARHIDDLATLLDEPTLIVGWSWGAMLGLSFAVARPELVRGLVLVGCGTYDETTRAEYQQRFAAKLGIEGIAEMDVLRAQLSEANTREERDAIVADRGLRAERAQSYDLLPFDDEPRTAVDALGHEETWDDVLRLQRDGVEPAAFATITAPVVMLHGDDDPHPGLATFEVLREHIPHLEYFGLSRCGHTPWKERHAHNVFFAALRAWLHAHA